MAIYIVYFRILRHGKVIARIENDLRLRNYINNELLPLDRTLPKGQFLFERAKFGKRPDDNPEKMSQEEKIGCLGLFIFFVLTSIILFWG